MKFTNTIIPLPMLERYKSLRAKHTTGAIIAMASRKNYAMKMRVYNILTWTVLLDEARAENADPEKLAGMEADLHTEIVDFEARIDDWNCWKIQWYPHLNRNVDIDEQKLEMWIMAMAWFEEWTVKRDLKLNREALYAVK